MSPKTCPVYDYKQVLGLDAAGHMTSATSTSAPPSAPPPAAGSGSAVSKSALSLTSHGPAVKVLQNLLVMNGIACSPDGVFGQGTAANVRRFQTRAGLSVTGQAELHQVDVRDDGSSGPLTKSAVERFPRKVGVPTTGVVDVATRLKSFN